MNDHDPHNRPARLEQTRAQVRKVRQARTTMRLVWVVTLLAIILTVVLLRRYGVL